MINGQKEISRLGKFFRRFNLDELPQFINVLFNSMSIVGPRPHMLSEDQEFEKIAADYSERRKVKPGMTGLAQINGYAGPIKSNDELLKRTEFDLDYVSRQSVLLDIEIIVSTVLMLFKRLFEKDLDA